MKATPKVSVTVPVYNQEKLLKRCVDSLINQTLSDIEIILVDDGSTDSSPVICDWYGQEDSRIKVVHKENGGSASARQVALDILTGEYSIVCDSDDWVEPEMYEKLYNTAKSTLSDIIVCGFFYDYSDGTSKAYYPTREDVTNDEALKNILMDKMSGSTCNKLIKTSFLKNNDIKYVKGINLGEDFLLSVQCALKGAKYAFVSAPLYHYFRRQGEETYTNNLSLVSYNQLAESVDWLEYNMGDRYYPKGIFHRKVNLTFAGIRTVGMTSSFLRQTALKRFSVLDFIRYRAFSIKDFYVLIVKLFGYRIGKGLMKLTYRFFYQ